MKICVLVIFVILPWISRAGDWALSWTEGNERLQIIFVMMLFPLIMNALQYYIIDSFIKAQHIEHERLPQEDPADEAAVYDTRISESSGAIGEDEEDVKLRRATAVREEEYDPDLDGDSSLETGSSSTRTPERGVAVAKELFPKE